MGKASPITGEALPALWQHYFRLKWSIEEFFMTKKIAKYTLPRSEEALDTLAHSVLTYATPHIEGAGTKVTVTHSAYENGKRGSPRR
jgi:hypothetical protein